MRRIFFGGFVFVSSFVEAQQGDLWLDIAKAAYIQDEVERLGVKQTCASIAQVGWNAAVERDRDRSYLDVSQDDSVYESWHHPFIDLRLWQRRAIELAFDNYSVSPGDISQAIDLQCGGGRGVFSELYEKLMTTPLAPEVDENLVTELACTRYGQWAANMVYFRDVLNRPHWFMIERGVSTESKDMTYSLQVDIVNFLYENKSLTQDEIRESIISDCFDGEGFFYTGSR